MEIIDKTSCGRATVIGLRLNRSYLVTARRHWMADDLHPPKSEQQKISPSIISLQMILLQTPHRQRMFLQGFDPLHGRRRC